MGSYSLLNSVSSWGYFWGWPGSKCGIFNNMEWEPGVCIHPGRENGSPCIFVWQLWDGGKNNYAAATNIWMSPRFFLISTQRQKENCHQADAGTVTEGTMVERQLHSPTHVRPVLRLSGLGGFMGIKDRDVCDIVWFFIFHSFFTSCLHTLTTTFSFWAVWRMVFLRWDTLIRHTHVYTVLASGEKVFSLSKLIWVPLWPSFTICSICL